MARASGNSSRPPEDDGFTLSGVPAHGADASATGRTVRLDLKGSLAASRDRGAVESAEVVVANDDLLELELRSDERLWMSADAFRQQFDSSSARGVGGRRKLVLSELVPRFPFEGTTRGPIGLVLKALHVFGIDLAGKAASEIAGLIEERNALRGSGAGFGLKHCELGPGGFALNDLQAGTRECGAYLLLLHGTASSTWGSFGDLWSNERSAELDTLRSLYRDRVMTLEHRSLTKSPVENTLELLRALAQKLPDNAELHVVSHGQGGLIGELLSRVSNRETAPLDGRWFRRPGYERQAAALDELNRAIGHTRFGVTRFVRVACPTLGTTLASERLDRAISLICSIAGNVIPSASLSTLFEGFSDLLAAIVKERTEPEHLPGLEAVMPGSPFIALINQAAPKQEGRLFAIAGDTQAESMWWKLAVWLTDRFYGGEHDLVVDTESMCADANPRGASLVSRHTGDRVNHFSYFGEAESARQLVAALRAGDDAPDGFEPIAETTTDGSRSPRRSSTTASGSWPILFVVPGLFGSELSVDQKPVWPDAQRLSRDTLGQLSLEIRNVVATSLLTSHYGALLSHLADTHTVVPFPYDWRLPIREEAERLAGHVAQYFRDEKRMGQPVRFLAHSTGGLLVHALATIDPSLWNEIFAADGARFVMLGTPTRGSHATVELLVGRAPLARMLALLDGTTGARQKTASILCSYPGLLDTLPDDPRENYFEPATWRKLGDANRDHRVVPDARQLARAEGFRKELSLAAMNPRKSIYVAGTAAWTTSRIRVDRGRDGTTSMVEFQGTNRGDGVVTWESGPPPGIPIFYLNAGHGDLVRDKETFSDLVQILGAGALAPLRRSAPLSRRDEIVAELDEPRDVLYPNNRMLESAAMGSLPRTRQRARGGIPVEVEVVHGNLLFARDPVLLGHYSGDAIVSAERVLDRALGGVLSRRHALRLYPGELETCVVAANPTLRQNRFARPKGALIVGLGSVAALDSYRLTRTFIRALTQYALEWSPQDAADASDEPVELGISSVLVGTAGNVLTVPDSIFSLLSAVAAANESLASGGVPREIRRVEIIELWEDRAIQAAHALRSLRENARLKNGFEMRSSVRSQRGGLSRAAYAEPDGWWQRVQILGKDDGRVGARGVLRFTSSTKRARSEVRLLATERKILDEFIRLSVGEPHDNGTVARTLFELLLPNELKENSPVQDDVVLTVDPEAAAYPWELIRDPWSEDGLPISIQHGLLRQLESEIFRRHVVNVQSKTAIVIGDPVSDFVELNRAQKEADRVQQLLKSADFEVQARKRPTAPQVLNLLFNNECKVLHLAGHGVYGANDSEEGTTGMVIGEGLFLTAAVVRQMRRVPELVFINCCYLGKVESPKPSNRRQDYHRLAANLATQFIRMGVRAVVAAGWAVDDLAAEVFATEFYQQMIRGETFGSAVLAARRKAWHGHAHTNTWGAYQCYGEPDYRLVRTDASVSAPDRRPNFVSPREVDSVLNNFAESLASSPGDVPPDNKAWLRRVVGDLQRDYAPWLSLGRVRAALGRACAAAEILDDAVAHYEEALKAEDGQLTLDAFINMLNVYVQDTTAPDPRKSADLTNAIERLQTFLDAIAPPGASSEPFSPTAHQLSILGSAYKRLAQRGPRESRVENMRQMRDRYEQAYRRRSGTYETLNWIASEIVLGWYEQEPSGDLERIRSALDALEMQAEKEFEQEPSFSSAIAICDSRLFSGLLRGKLGKRLVTTLADEYDQARKLGTQREVLSTSGQLNFLEEMAREVNVPFADALKQLNERIRGST